MDNAKLDTLIKAQEDNTKRLKRVKFFICLAMVFGGIYMMASSMQDMTTDEATDARVEQQIRNAMR